MVSNKKLGTSVINRRNFVQTAALLAAGSTLPVSLLGCADNVVMDIPCLGPAAAPTPVAGMTYIRASELGCALDCKLETGRNKHTGGPATDDGPRINAAMAGATANHPITLIIDGSALISGLFLPAGGHWSIAGLGCGTGFFIASGTNNDGIHNGPPNAAVPSDPGPPAPPRGSNVSLSNFSVNGNQGDGVNGVSTTGRHQGISNTTWFFCINLMNLDNISVENVVVVNSPSYHFRFSNVGNVTVTGCVMVSVGDNTDGLHFNGPANDINISKCSFTMNDDSIALNCSEGYRGNISRVTVTDCTFNGFSLLRMYTNTYTNGVNIGRFYVDTVKVSNCQGTFTEVGFMIGVKTDIDDSNPDSVTGLVISNCTITAPAVLGVAENFGDIELTDVTFIPQTSNSRYPTYWAPTVKNHTTAFLRPSPPYSYVTYIGSRLVLNNCTIILNANTDVPAILLEDDSIIKYVELNGFSMKGSSNSFKSTNLLNLEQGSIGELVINSLDTSGVLALASSSTLASIGSIAGKGVLATNWKLPDAVVANNVPYLSASTGRASIKIAGIVESYP